jgi:hypothetical protein
MVHPSRLFIKAMEELADDEWWLEPGIVNVRQIRRMQDVEFMSELFAALIVSPQDKKSTLEDLYANFEASMPEEVEWVARFEYGISLDRLCHVMNCVLGVERATSIRYS